MDNAPQNGQSTQRAATLPDLELPISNNPRHPVNSQGANVYFSRTDNLIGLTPERQAEILAETLRGVGPGKTLLLEANGPRNGSYINELAVALPAALAMVPENQRPEIRLFISDGRPVIADPNQANDPTAPRNDFTTFLQGLEAQKKGSGIIHTDTSQSVHRVIPNWNNPEVVDYFIRERVQPTIELAQRLGIRDIVVDDHIGVPAEHMGRFKAVNGLTSDRQAQDVITGAYSQVLGAIREAGINPGLSTAADPVGNLRFGIDMQRLAPQTNRIEIQGYRQSADAVGDMVNNLYNDVSRNFEQYRGVREFNIALVTRANGVSLSPDTLIQQQDVINRFEQRIGALYTSRGEQAPEVSTSLWAHQNFYQDPLALRQGQQGPRVRELQEALNAAGIQVNGQPLAVTGTFDDNTKKAVAAYQKENELAISGEADKRTLLSLGIHPRQHELPSQTAPEPTPPTPTPPAPTPTPTPTPTPLQSNAPANLDESSRQLITHRDHPGNAWMQQANAALLRTPEGQQMSEDTRNKAAALMALESVGRLNKIESAEVLSGGTLIASDRATTRQADARLASADTAGLAQTSLQDISQKFAQLPESLRNRTPEPLSETNALARHQQNPNEQLANPALAQETRQASRAM